MMIERNKKEKLRRKEKRGKILDKALPKSYNLIIQN